MKYKHVAVIMGAVMSAMLMSGCAGNGNSQDGETVYGQVTKVSDGSITIDVGTMNEEPPSGENPGDSSESTEETNTDGSSKTTEETKTDDNDKTTEETETNDGSKATEETVKQSSEDKKAPDGDGGAPSMLELTGESQTIKITDDTVVTKKSMGGGPGGAPGNGEQPPEKPDDAEELSGNKNTDAGESTETDENTENKSTDGSENTENKSTDGSENTDGGKSSDDSENAGNGEQPPEKPDGAEDNGEKPEEPNQESEEASLDDISEGDTVEITFDSKGNAAEIEIISGQMGGGGGQSEAPEEYEAATEYTEDTEKEGETISSTATDENAIHVYSGATAVLDNYLITRKSSDSKGGDSSSFYGVGAALLTTDGTTYIKNSTIETNAGGGAGLFAYNKGTIYTADTKISTSEDTSGGIHVAGGGSLYAWDMDVTTKGASSAAIRSDRGGGTMVVDGGTYTSNGTGSPAVYCTADIAIDSAELTANNSEAVCIEGLNSLRLYNSNLTGNMPDDEQNDCSWNVILYQSMSGDSEVGNSTFEMDGGTLTAKNGGMFYTTNTESTFVLSDVDITYADENDYFLKCTGNNNQRGWGTSGNNGAETNFTAIKQEMQGDVIWDSISNLDFYMTDGSSLTGAVTDDETCAGEGGDGYCNLYIEKGSTWTVTGDSTLTSLSCAGTIQDASGKTVTIKGTDGTVYVKGDSEYTITVDKYSDSADVSGASKTSNWSDYEVEKPSELE